MKKYIILFFSLICGYVATATDFPDFPFVYSEGRSTTNITPDVAVIDLTIFCYDKASSNASASVENTCTELINSLQNRYGIDSSYITAKNLRKNVIQKRDDNYERLEILGYNVSRNVSFEVKKIELFPSIMRMLSSTDLVTNIDADFKRSDEDIIISKLTTGACKEANGKAELLAKSSGGELGSLFAISTSGLDNLSVKFRPRFMTSGKRALFGFSGSMKEDIPFFAPDTIEYEATVTTIYKLK